MCLSVAINRPDHVLAKGEHLGFEWTVVHNGMGFRCGYVRVPLGHPWHGLSWDDNLDADMHGGCTFAEPDVEFGGQFVDNAWWIGFDCAHSMDSPDPSLPNSMKPFGHGVVRTQEYVESECINLCVQAAAAISKETSDETLLS